jgi:hypothetical protein
MHDWQLGYLGRHAFPADVTEFELRRAFTFDEAEREEIRRSFRSRLRIGIALQLGFLRLTGTTLGSLEYVPSAVLRHVGLQFALPAPDLATLRGLYRREKTRSAYQRWAIEYGGFRQLDVRSEQLLAAFIRERTHGSIARPRLEQHARAWLYQNAYLIPRARRVSDLVRAVIRAVTTEDHATLIQTMGAAPMQACLQKLLQRRPGHTMTQLEWLRRPPGKRSLKTLRLLLEKHTWLEALVGPCAPLPISRERQRVYARRFRRRRSSHIPQLPLFRQELEATCFAIMTLGTLVGGELPIKRRREFRIAHCNAVPRHSEPGWLWQMRRFRRD